MRRFLALALIVVAVLGASSTASADVQLAMQGGRVTLIAKDATVRQILAEWARVGQTKIINAERIPGGPISLQLTDVSEQEALDVLLRAVSGYLAAPRATSGGNLSVFDRIMVMPTSVAPPPSAVNPPPPPPFAQPFYQWPPTIPDEQDDIAQVPPQNRGPATPTPAPAVAYPGAPTTATPAGVAVPGMMVPAPQSSSPGQQPGQPASPSQPRK